MKNRKINHPYYSNLLKCSFNSARCEHYKSTMWRGETRTEVLCWSCWWLWELQWAKFPRQLHSPDRGPAVLSPSCNLKECWWMEKTSHQSSSNIFWVSGWSGVSSESSSWEWWWNWKRKEWELHHRSPAWVQYFLLTYLVIYIFFCGFEELRTGLHSWSHPTWFSYTVVCSSSHSF